MSNYTAVITGGSKGIGADLAQRMLEEESDGECLAAIERSDLKRFGLTKLGPQKKLLNQIASLQ